MKDYKVDRLVRKIKKILEQNWGKYDRYILDTFDVNASDEIGIALTDMEGSLDKTFNLKVVDIDKI